MKNKIIIASIIFSVAITGCSKNKQDVTEPTTDIQVSTEEKETPDIFIFTKDANIKYEKYFLKADKSSKDEERYANYIIDFQDNLEQDKLITLSNNEDIRIDFNKDLPKDKEINIEKLYVKENSKEDDVLQTDTFNMKIDENGFVDFKHTYDEKDMSLKGTIYNIKVNEGKDFYSYIFCLKVDNKIKKNTENTESKDNKEENKRSGYLSLNEQKIYDSYKKDKNMKALSNIEPITIAKLYANAIINKDYDLSYSFYDTQSEKPTKEEYVKIMNSLDKDIINQYVDNIRGVEKGKFIQEDNKGYIQYELTPDHPMAIDMIKDKDNVWKIQYLPVQ